MAVPGAVPATMPRRLLAAVVDGVAALVLGGAFVLAGVLPLLTAGGESAPAPGAGSALLLVGGVASLTLALVQWWLLATRGATLGKRLVGLRAVSADDGRPVGLARALVRLLVPAAASLVPLLGPALVYVSPFFDGSGRRRGWHDLAAGTVVYDVARGVDPVTGPRPSREEVARRLEQVVGPHVTSGTPVVTEVPRPQPPSELVGPLPLATSSSAVDPAPTAPTASTPPTPPAAAGPGVISAVPRSTAPTAVPGSPADPADAPSSPSPVAVGTVPAGPDPADVTQPLATSRVVPRDDDVLTAVPFPGRHDDEDVEMTRMRPARSRVPELPTTEPQATVSLSDGQRVSFTGVALVGRHPSPRPDEQVACLIAVADPGRSVSKTHLAIGVDRHGVWVKDRASTNGTVVTLPDGQQILCGAHQQVRLPEGASVAFGDYGLDVAELSVVGQGA